MKTFNILCANDGLHYEVEAGTTLKELSDKICPDVPSVEAGHRRLSGLGAIGLGLKLAIFYSSVLMNELPAFPAAAQSQFVVERFISSRSRSGSR